MALFSPGLKGLKRRYRRDLCRGETTGRAAPEYRGWEPWEPWEPWVETIGEPWKTIGKW